MLKEHNKEVFAEMEELLMTEGCCCVVMGTGVGKSYIIKELLEKKKFHALVVSPRQSINRSWEKLCGKKVETVTYQKLANIYKEIDYSYYNIVVCDEVHHIGAPKWGKAIKYLIDNKITMVVGLTESSVRYSDGARDVALEFFNGNVAFGVDVPTAIKNKILNPVTYVGAMYNSDGLKKTLRGKIQSRLYAKLNLVLNKTPTVEEIIKKHMPQGNRKGIIFASTIDDIKFAIDFMHNIYPDAKIRVMHSKLPKSVIEKNMNWFKRAKSGYLCSVDMISEGVHIKGVNTLIMLRRTESVNLFNQQLGRCLSASSKEPAILFDLVNNQYSVHITQNRVHIRMNTIKDSGKLNVVASDQLIIEDYQKNIVEVLEEIKKSFDKEYTEEEDNIIRDNVSLGLKALCELLPNRTAASIRYRVYKLGLKLTDRVSQEWSEEEKEIIRKYYPEKGTAIVDMLPERTKTQIKDWARSNNVRYKHYVASEEWSEEEDEIIKRFYAEEGPKIVKRFHNRTYEAIRKRAHKLNVVYVEKTKKPYSQEEKDFLCKNYPEFGAEYCAKMLSRSKSSIITMVSDMGLKYVHNKNASCWSEEENKIFYKYYPLEGKAVAKRLPNKTARQIASRIQKFKSSK